MAVIKLAQEYLQFTAPEKVDISTRLLPEPDEDEVLVKTSLSAISSGTEKLIFQGLFPDDEERDSSLPALRGSFQYPFQYGYSCVGTVVQVGDEKHSSWIGRRVFAFQPHASCFLSKFDDLIPIPDEISDDEAVFLPNMETAVNFALDGAPLIGERVAIIGLGIVGLLTTSLLGQMPLDSLVGIDLLPARREIVNKMINTVGISPDEALKKRPENGYDLIYELSGSLSGLNLAIDLAGFESRIMIGSWYGKKGGEINLGGKFHRSRIKLVSSQVSTFASNLIGRWDKQRRFSIVFQQLNNVRPSRWISHRFPLEEASEAYRQLISHPEDTFQVIFTYNK